jgi:hypothetical protein
MLSPQERKLLREALRPPDGYSLDQAIMTTYSLDLMALLSIPLAFSVFHLEGQGERLEASPLALLNALRQYSSRIVVFCQAGQIAVPRQTQLLLGYMENSVIEVKSPRGGVFHPKLSIIKYVRNYEETEDPDFPGGPAVVYRCLCGTRNLTFDRSWDTILVLEGSLHQGRKQAFARNHELSKFIAALPRLALRTQNDKVTGLIKTISEELKFVEFREPEGIEDIRFWPIGIDERKTVWPFDGCEDTLVMSPFVSDGFITRLCANQGYHQLISRHESLEALSAGSLENLDVSYYLNPAAESSGNEETGDSAPKGEGQGDQAALASEMPIEFLPASELRDLHAKLFIADCGWDARLWTGSANATTSAFDKNVEFLVELIGKKSKWGIDQFLGSSSQKQDSQRKDRELRFVDLLLRYERLGPPSTSDPDEEKLDQLLQKARRSLAFGRLSSNVVGHEGDPKCYKMELRSEAPESIEYESNTEIACRPISLSKALSKPLKLPLQSIIVEFDRIMFRDLTSFFAFDVVVRLGSKEKRESFVLNVPLIGTPENRLDEIMISLLNNRKQLLSYILMLLSGDKAEFLELGTSVSKGQQAGKDQFGLAGFGASVLEPLLKALDQQPERLDQIEDLVKDLQKTAEGRELLTEEFVETWRAISQERKAAGNG